MIHKSMNEIKNTFHAFGQNVHQIRKAEGTGSM